MTVASIACRDPPRYGDGGFFFAHSALPSADGRVLLGEMSRTSLCSHGASGVTAGVG